MRSRVRAAVAFIAAIGISSCGSSTDPDDAPYVESIAVAAAPIAPAGTTPLCFTGPDSVTLSPTCPVIKWNDVTYWVFAYDDSRNALSLVAYDEDDNILHQSEREGTTQLYLITVNHNTRNVVLYGHAAATLTVPWLELEID